MTGRKLVLVELNEINFDVVRSYLDSIPGSLPALRELMSGKGVRTVSESRYDLLEPWVQWPSVHTGHSFDGHRLFRLGDVVASDLPQFFEQLEAKGHRVGAISPMNAANRLKSPAYFIPDPWTATPSDGSWWSRKLGAAVSQAVNDNAQARIRPLNVIWLLLGLLRFARPKNYLAYLKLAFRSRGAPWRKALFLDLFLHDLHVRLLLARKPDFSVLFLNAGAHIQHHYFLNAAPLRAATSASNPAWYVSPKADPIAEMLEVYDRIVGDYQSLAGVEAIVATGLSQIPYDRVKFYYRLKTHSTFLDLIGVRYREVRPRMTRDFLVEFENVEEAAEAEAKLRRVFVGGQPFFGKIDNRGISLFVTLTYPDEIRADTEFESDGKRHGLFSHVAFVAIKNGMHQETGFAYFSRGVSPFAPEDGAHVAALHGSVMQYFSGQG